MDQYLFDKLPPEVREAARQSDIRLSIVESYMCGFEDAVNAYSIWKNGRRTIGVMEMDPTDVINSKREQLLNSLAAKI